MSTDRGQAMFAEVEAFAVSEAYRPRPIRFRELRTVRDWRLKVYEITYGDEPLDWPVYEAVLPELLTILPNPPRTRHRPGVGFIIAHQGRGWHYFVLQWWDHENELGQKIFVRRFGPGEKWRPAVDESICVWDLQVLWFEREAYVSHILSRPDAPDLDGYLATRLEIR